MESQEGERTDITFWESLEDLKATEALFIENEISKKLMQVYEPKSLDMRRYNVIKKL